jgi:hypothetical protein
VSGLIGAARRLTHVYAARHSTTSASTTGKHPFWIFTLSYVFAPFLLCSGHRHQYVIKFVRLLGRNWEGAVASQGVDGFHFGHVVTLVLRLPIGFGMLISEVPTGVQTPRSAWWPSKFQWLYAICWLFTFACRIRDEFRLSRAIV